MYTGGFVDPFIRRRYIKTTANTACSFPERRTKMLIRLTGPVPRGASVAPYVVGGKRGILGWRVRTVRGGAPAFDDAPKSRVAAAEETTRTLPGCPVAAAAAAAVAVGVRRPTTSSTPPSGPGPRTATPPEEVRPRRRRNGRPTVVRRPVRHRRDRSLRRRRPPTRRTAAKCHCPGRVPTSCPSTSRSKSPTTVVRR